MVNMRETSFENVSSRAYGGAIYINGLNAATAFNINNCIFHDTYSVKGAIIYSIFANRDTGKISI